MTQDPNSPEGPDPTPLSSWDVSRDALRTQTRISGPGFTPGTILAGRYRIVALLGIGGMGQVYRAEDTRLGQSVALKFVRGGLSDRKRERLYREVRIGREISHPNVCRLYDIVELEGQTFIAMEYVDGEDLATLLSRIGRLPTEKALGVARDVAAGLAAMHEKEAVHRDLKPANVMIDGRGRARLTDFGLAIAREDAEATDAFAGTPRYMAPEQLTGAPVTPRSDLYALGLILFEMVTGRPFYDAHSLAELRSQHVAPHQARLSGLSPRLDPAVERLILRCLEAEPEERPPSARAILSTLPGGDPLEVAVAAGDTPSPEMVEAAGKVGDVPPPIAWLGLLATLGGLALVAWMLDRSTLIGAGQMPNPPGRLVERARTIVGELGYSPGRSEAWSFELDRPFLDVVRRDRSADRWRSVPKGHFSPYYFYYRSSPTFLRARNSDSQVRRFDPPRDLPGMTEVVLDPRGRLTGFLAVPPQVQDVAGDEAEVDWSDLFEAAGLDPAKLRPAPSRWAAPVDTDRKAAWEGAFPDESVLPIRIEAAAYRGRPVWFAVLPPWRREGEPVTGTGLPDTVPVGEMSVWALALLVPLGGLAIARRNLRLGRGDRAGAFRVALFVFLTYSLARLFRASHVASPTDEIEILIGVFSRPAFWAAFVWVLYVALEPYARRRWPHALISWKRLLSGRLRDPLVGRDVLLGTVAGSASAVLFVFFLVAPARLGLPPPLPQPYLHGTTLAGFSDVGFRLFVNLFSSVLYAMVFLFMLVLLRILLRNGVLATVLWCFLVGSPLIGENVLFELGGGLLRAAILFLVLTRGGVLALAVSLYVMFNVFESPFTLDLSAWYATRALPVALALVALAAYGFHTSLGGRPAFGRALLED